MSSKQIELIATIVVGALAFAILHSSNIVEEYLNAQTEGRLASVNLPGFLTTALIIKLIGATIVAFAFKASGFAAKVGDQFEQSAKPPTFKAADMAKALDDGLTLQQREDWKRTLLMSIDQKDAETTTIALNRLTSRVWTYERGPTKQ